ncbi:MAG: ABC transporter permease, partial [Endomicrobiia bacterium]
MDSLFKIALRNLKRNKRRSLLAIVSVTLAIMFVIILQGLVDGMIENMIKNSTKNDTGHIRIMHKEYFKKIHSLPIRYVVLEPQKVIEHILTNKIIKQKIYLITERIKFPVLISFKANNKTAICIAGDIEKEKSLLMLDKFIVEGRYLSGKTVNLNNKKYYEIIVGKKFADILGLKVGDTFSVILQNIELGVSIPSFYVVGVFNTGLNILDENIFMINLHDAKKILKTRGASQEIFIMLKRYKDAKKISNIINSILNQNDEFKDLVSVDWKESGFLRMMEQALQIYNLLYITVTILGAFIITNIMMMVVLERKYEIGILKSMGLKNFQILKLFTLEGTILGSIGSFCGIILGIIICIPLSIYGIDFSSSMSNMNFPMDNVIRWVINVSSIIVSMFMGIVVSAIMSLIPSRYASKMKIVDAIKI